LLGAGGEVADETAGGVAGGLVRNPILLLLGGLALVVMLVSTLGPALAPVLLDYLGVGGDDQ